MHCAVPFFLCPKRNGRRGSVSLRGMLRAACGRGSGLRGRASALRGGRKCSARACRCAGASGGLRRGMGGEVGGRASRSLRACVGAAGASGGLRRGVGCEVGGRASRSLRACVGTAWAGVGIAWGSGSAREGRVAVLGRAEVFGGEWVVRSVGNALRSLRACVGAAWGSGSARRGRVAVRGRAKVFGWEWAVRSADLTHIRRSSTRARVLLYIRPPCPRREIAAMGPKDAPCEYPSPAKAFAPAPSAFALPRPRSHFPRPRSHFPRIAFHFPRGAIGLPQQQLSTMGYPRKSYPHRCPPACAKRSRPRACARVYINIVRPSAAPGECTRRSGKESTPLWHRVPRRRAQGGGGQRQRRTPPRTATRPCRAFSPPLSAYRRAPAA